MPSTMMSGVETADASPAALVECSRARTVEPSARAGLMARLVEVVVGPSWPESEEGRCVHAHESAPSTRSPHCVTISRWLVPDVKWPAPLRRSVA